jgi:hypothetical protein
MPKSTLGQVEKLTFEFFVLISNYREKLGILAPSKGGIKWQIKN